MGVEQVYVEAKFGRWTVLEIGLDNPKSKAKQKVKWALCQCECGTQKLRPYRDLYDGRTKSCGCLAREKTIQMNWDKGTIPLGTKFGKLTVIEDLGYRKQNSRDKQIRWYKCKCDCGNIIEVLGNNLKTGGSQSCGCVHSRGEKIIQDILLQNNILFKKEYTFDDLCSQKGNRLRFDFAIFNEDNTLIKLIEFQGRQHYFGPDAKWKNSDSLETIQKRDQQKVEYCQRKNIPLLIIPYTDIGKIDLNYLLLEEGERE